MKMIIIWISFILNLSFIIHQNSFADVKSKITFIDGSKITGVIIPSNNKDSVYLNLGGGFTASYPMSQIKDITSQRKHITLGLGFGIPYAMFGVNVEIEPVPHIDLIVGIGTTIFTDVSWDIGAIGYIFDQDNFIRPRILLIYGTNSILKYSSNYESFAGLSIGGGIQTRIGETFSTTLDIMINLINGYDDKRKELEKQGYYFVDEEFPINFSVGFQFSL